MLVKTFVFDLDGVVYRGKQPVPGAAETIDSLLNLGHKVYYFTNNATKTRASFVKKLADMGIKSDNEHIMTSSYATAIYLRSKGAEGGTVYIIGEEGINEELKAIGMKAIDDPMKTKADYVVVGLDRGFDYGKLTKAQYAILGGATFIATNRDPTFPMENDRVAPGGGSVVAAVATASLTKPLVIGKPEVQGMRDLIKIAETTPHRTVVVGDRLDTDILAGNRVGAKTVLVLTGVTTKEELKEAGAELQPDIVIDNLNDMLKYEELVGGTHESG